MLSRALEIKLMFVLGRTSLESHTSGGCILSSDACRKGCTAWVSRDWSDSSQDILLCGMGALCSEVSDMVKNCWSNEEDRLRPGAGLQLLPEERSRERRLLRRFGGGDEDRDRCFNGLLLVCRRGRGLRTMGLSQTSSTFFVFFSSSKESKNDCIGTGNCCSILVLVRWCRWAWADGLCVVCGGFFVVWRTITVLWQKELLGSCVQNDLTVEQETVPQESVRHKQGTKSPSSWRTVFDTCS